MKNKRISIFCVILVVLFALSITEVAAQQASILDQVVKRGSVRVGVCLDAPPYSWKKADGSFDGIDGQKAKSIFDPQRQIGLFLGGHGGYFLKCRANGVARGSARGGVRWEADPRTARTITSKRVGRNRSDEGVDQVGRRAGRRKSYSSPSRALSRFT